MLKIGTDCSGIEAPIQALRNLSIEYDHIFSCEIDKYARASINANYVPKKMYKDIADKKDKCQLDVYVCGFPCQPFSLSGNRLGSEDSRGKVFEHCINSIKETNTKVFILENVRGIMSVEKGTYWKHIINTLSKLEHYNVHFKVMNTKDYGIPQNRERVYIIGIRKDIQKCEFNFPDKIESNKLSSYVDRDNNIKQSIPVKNEDVAEIIRNSKATFLNLGFQNFKTHSYEHYSPSIIAQASMWCVPMQRKASTKELLSLQGFNNFIQVVSDTQMKKQIGNSMSVNVLEKLFIEIFKCF